MKIKSIQIQNLKGFKDTKKLQLSPTINILIGPNNSGKSTIIRSCYLLQIPNENEVRTYLNKNKRKGEKLTTIEIGFDEFDGEFFNLEQNTIDHPDKWEISVKLLSNQNSQLEKYIPDKLGKSRARFQFISNVEPNNFIYPIFSKRKVTAFNQVFTKVHAETIQEDFRDLYAKIKRIADSAHPNYIQFRKACSDILNLNISCPLSSMGSEAGMVISNNDYIPIDEMGEGTSNLLGIIVDLCVAENKLFLIEEIENDIHPQALKKLLELIISKSNNNQFILSTHSNIVTKYLGAEENSKIFQCKMTVKDKLPLTIVKNIPNTSGSRIKALEELGYELIDFDLWKAYLILEESSAERIIRDFLIPEFVPSLKFKLRTIAADGVSDLGPRVHDLLRLFVFIHLSKAYQNKAWVFADGDHPGLAAIKKLKKDFKSWDEKHFGNFTQPNFENYYPEKWRSKVKKALAIFNKKEKRREKEKLVVEVINWALSNKREAKKGFRESAAEIIKILKKIDKSIG